MLIKVTNLSYIVGGGKIPERWRKCQNRIFNFKNDFTDEQILNIISHKGYFPTTTTKIIRNHENN